MAKTAENAGDFASNSRPDTPQQKLIGAPLFAGFRRSNFPMALGGHHLEYVFTPPINTTSRETQAIVVEPTEKLFD